ncbi:uncharacterized protein LOC105689481 isoform X2 [Athalia rosae]|uniref:uncharacterized protein LOC105689481 isoform X2 n=1 Tax=Athalia rosae TaxID=37344 RepID=UPI00203340A2|nr:uncharacterized protein LOC105689481 isoform X2 [Athalia rosae]
MTRSGPPLASCSCCYHRSSEKNITQSAPTNKYKSSKKFLNHATVVAFIVISLSNLQQPCEAAFYGKSLGKLTEYHHGVSGEVFAVDARTLYIKDLTYDGEGPAAYFYAGNSKAPIINGFRVPDEKGRTGLLRKYRKEDITLTLPEGKTLNNIRWFSLWCDDFSVNFGDVKIPRGFDYPRPQKLGTLSGIHGVSSEPIVVVDAQTLLIPGFSYDGEAPDAKFWAGPGPSPTPQGIKIPDENGKTAPLRRYVQKTIVLTLPGDLTVHQLGHFGVWCEAFTVDFGHVKIPQNLNVPPSLKMLGVSPQNMRGGQGQLGQLGKERFTLSPASNVEHSSSSLSSHGQQQQHQEQDLRVTTYRPIIRRNDQVQVIQSVDYRIPKSLEQQEPIQQVPQFQPQISNHQDYFIRNGNSQQSTYDIQNSIPQQLQQIANVRTSFSTPFNNRQQLQQQPYPNQYSNINRQQQLEYPQQLTNNHHFSNNGGYFDQALAVRQQQEEQQQQNQGSYARFLRYPGDQNLNSYVRY